ncbi:MAG TPA: M14 family zinc carboxypeptidase, partial [Gemmatimonadales bacterium]|nr:M14 family zinc carboxypeptidase [Gemmatimonadales bacterium]
MNRFAVFATVMLATTSPLAAQLTVPERTAMRRTSTHAEVLAFLDSLQARGAAIQVGTLGTSPRGLHIPYVVAARPMVSSPAEAKRSGKPVIYVQANIHAGEVEGKEALQQVLRELTLGAHRALLDSIILIAVPIYNTDGNEAWGPGTRNRPGQNGPDTVGLR